MRTQYIKSGQVTNNLTAREERLEHVRSDSIAVGCSIRAFVNFSALAAPGGQPPDLANGIVEQCCLLLHYSNSSLSPTRKSRYCLRLSKDGDVRRTFKE